MENEEPAVEREIVLLPKQLQFVNSPFKFSAYVGGLGGGKSYALAVWIIYVSQRYPECLGLITANSYSQLNDATLVTLFNLCDDLGIPYEYVQTKGHLRLGRAKKILCRSSDTYPRMRGIEVGWWASDELAFMPKVAFNVISGRLRDKRGPLQFRGATTPNGKNFVYDYFVDSPKPDYQLIRSTSSENIHLPEGYIASLEGQYDSKLLQQERDAEFLDLTSGSVYYGFNRDRNVLPADFKLPDNVSKINGCDFNVDPLTAVCAWTDGVNIYVMSELFLRDSNTYRLADELVKATGLGTLLIPDSTGNARKTSSTTTDHEILRRAGNIIPHVHNPAVHDRHNCLNGLLEHGRIKIHPSCKMIVRDLENSLHKQKDPLVGHISDALGYVAWHLFPLKKPQLKSRTIQL